jgi:sugar porter (SP) family MFS transporter
VDDRRRRTLLRWALSAATGGFVFGYQLGVIAGTLLFVRRDFGLSEIAQGALVSVMPLGAMAGALVASRLADGLGRRRTLIGVSLVLMAACALSAAAPDAVVLLLARAVIGLGVGAASSTIPLYLSEIAPPDRRGRLVTLNQLMIVSGILASYVVALVFSGSGQWRWMLAAGLLPVATLLAGMLRAPESPAWLDANGETEQARSVILRVASEDVVEDMLDGFRRLREQQRRALGVRDLVRSDARPALAIGVGLALAQQLGGISAIVYYAPRIMERTGLSASSSILYSVIVGLVNVGATVLAVGLIDRAGRRPLLLTSLAGMFLSLTLLGLTFELDVGSAGSWLALICILIYIASFATGMGPIFWVLIAEIFPPQARGAGAGLATAVNWFTNFLVGLLFLPVATAVGQGPTFWIFAVVSALAYGFVRRYVPETKGRTFSQIQAEVQARWGGRAWSTHLKSS